MARTMAFFTPIFPLLSIIPNLLHAFSVHLMNCYFPDFWYSHTPEKTIKKCFYFRNPAYTTDERGNAISTNFFRAIELWRFWYIMILEDSGDEQLSR